MTVHTLSVFSSFTTEFPRKKAHMATSSKVQFRLESLRSKALENIDSKIVDTEAKLQQLTDPDDLNRRIQDWRDEQEKRVQYLHSLLGSIDNYELSQFKLDEIPSVNRWTVDSLQRDLRFLKEKRSQILAKSQSVVGDEDGNVSLTKTQLAEFFGL